MVVASFTNSRIVRRFGARRVSHTALIGFLLVSVGQLVSAAGHDESLWQFVPLLALNMTMLGFVGANFSSIAMQSFGHQIGTALCRDRGWQFVYHSVVTESLEKQYNTHK